jgi:hypothetical protein
MRKRLLFPLDSYYNIQYLDGRLFTEQEFKKLEHYIAHSASGLSNVYVDEQGRKYYAVSQTNLESVYKSYPKLSFHRVVQCVISIRNQHRSMFPDVNYEVFDNESQDIYLSEYQGNYSLVIKPGINFTYPDPKDPGVEFNRTYHVVCKGDYVPVGINAWIKECLEQDLPTDITIQRNTNQQLASALTIGDSTYYFYDTKLESYPRTRSSWTKGNVHIDALVSMLKQIK